MRADTSTPGTFLDGLAPADRAALVGAGTARHYRKGEPLFVAGDAGGFVVLITGGRVKVTAPAPTGAEAVLSLRGPGDLVGELALADAPDERAATVVALEPVTCRVVRSDDFLAILAEHPAMALGLLRMMAARLTRPIAGSSSSAPTTPCAAWPACWRTWPTRRGRAGRTSAPAPRCTSCAPASRRTTWPAWSGRRESVAGGPPPCGRSASCRPAAGGWTCATSPVSAPSAPERP